MVCYLKISILILEVSIMKNLLGFVEVEML